MSTPWDAPSLSPEEALTRLKEGNRQFLQNHSFDKLRNWSPTLASDPQRPFAVVLGCSDSRTPVEILFGQGFGELFVVRVAGNVVAPSIVGSVEFAVSRFGSRLVVVMGHTQCGAIAATVEALQTGLGHASKNIRSITDRIAPNIREIVAEPHSADMLREAMRANVRASADHLRHGSPVIEDLVRSGRIAVVEAECELETGVVHFL